MRDVNRQTLATELVHEGQAPKSSEVMERLKESRGLPEVINGITKCCGEPVQVQALVSKCPVEALDESVLDRVCPAG